MIFKKSIDSILKNFNKNISDLRTIAAKHHESHILQNEVVIRATSAAENAALARDRAHRIADKLAELLN